MYYLNNNTVIKFIGDGVEGVDGIVSSPEELAEIIEDKIFEKNNQLWPLGRISSLVACFGK